MLKLVSRFAGDPNEKELETLQPLVNKVAELESDFQDLTNQQLRDKTTAFVGRLRAGESLDDLLPEAFAAVREASKRTTTMRHFDVQILGGIILHQGKVVEMKTGEGKTLVATLPLYLNALTGQGAHLVTVNDYLARRDVQWMGPVYHLLGLSVGLLQQGQDNAFVYDPEHTRGKFTHLRPVKRKEAYQAHITYGTNHEFGFDYLRDNLAFSLDRRVQRDLHYAIIDEVDNILIDEARTPLIISGPSDEPLEEYRNFARIARKLRADIDYEIDEKERNVILTDAGLAKVETETGIDNIYDEANYHYVHYMEQALRAQVLFRRDRDYIKQGQRIVLVDEFTGRLMPDRRLSEGLHQAIEAKEGVRIRPRMMTQATITLQNYFRMYDKLAGMTGTATTEAEELDKIYALDVLVLPTNVEYMARSPDSDLVEDRRTEGGVQAVIYHHKDNPDEILFYKRTDYQDVVYKTEESKWEAIANELERLHEIGRPVLVGTTSVAKSEHLSAILSSRGIDHEVLNAKNHTREAAIIAKAGEPKAVTIATNMAGRGVDIKLGGELPEDTIRAAHRVLRDRGIDPYKATAAQVYSAIAEVDPDYVRRREQVLELGGLHVLGTERHEARRIDNQLRGRAGRQGEPGSSRFYLSLEDDLMRRFGGPSVASLMDRLGVEEEVPIEHGLVSKTIEGAQSKVEGYNFDIRKHLLEYDDVLNRQRELIYGRRYEILTTNDLRPALWEMLQSETDHRLEEDLDEHGGKASLLAYLNDILPLLLAPPDSPFSFQFPFWGNLTCFPPFSISFLADRFADLPAEKLSDTLLEIGQLAIEEYRQHLLDTAVRDRFDQTLDRYQQDLDLYGEFLENKINDYVDLMEEQGRPLSSQDLLQYVQSVFPIPLNVRSSELRGLSPAEAEDELLARLESAYHEELCDKLIKAVRARTPAAMSLEKVKVSDIGAQQMEALFAGAPSATSDDETLSRLKRFTEGNRTLFASLSDMNRLVSVNLETLNAVLDQALSISYDRWAERQRAEMETVIQDKASGVKAGSAEALTRTLLEVFYTEKSAFDKGHKRRVTFVPRIPLPFLALPLIRDLDRDELRHAIMEQLEQALLAREAVWGGQQLVRLEQHLLADLGTDFYKGLLQHLGEAVIQDLESQLIGELDDELYDQMRCYLGIREMEEKSLAELEPYGELAQYLKREFEQELEEEPADLDQEMIQQAEEHLLEQGYLDDETARENLLASPLADLDKVARTGIASHLGLEMLDGLSSMAATEWGPQLRQGVREYLLGHGHFVDEEKVQRFFVHETLRDLGEETALEASAYITRRRLQKLANRTVGSLKGDVQEGILDYLQREGLFVDRAKQEHFEKQTWDQLDETMVTGLSKHLGSMQLETAGHISALPQEAGHDLQNHLRELDYFTDKELIKSFRQGTIYDLGNEVSEGIKDQFLSNLERDLSRKLIGELDAHLQERIHRHLEQADYFIDEDKARQFKSWTLSDLDASTLHELEDQLGHQIVDQIDQKKFMNLDKEIRESILNYLDLQGLFRKKKKRDQFVKGSLSDLDEGIRDGIAYHLGRDHLLRLREVRFAELPDELRDRIWQHLKDRDHFLDTEKEEYLEIEEVKNLEPELRHDLRSALNEDLEELLSQRKIAELPGEMQAEIQSYLDQHEYFLDHARMARFEALQAGELDPDTYDIVCDYLGQRVLAPIEGQEFAHLDDGLRQEIEGYLEGTDYFLDQAKRKKFMQRRLGELDDDLFEGLVKSLSRRLAEEMMHREMRELDEDDRELVRSFLDEIGYFLDEDALARFEQGSLADLNLDKTDYEGLASWLGQRRLEEKATQKFADLEARLKDAIEQYLSTTDYFLDTKKLQRFRDQGLTALDDSVQASLAQHLWERREQGLRQQSLAGLGEKTRRTVERFLSQNGLGLDEEGMAEFKGRRVGDLEDGLRSGLARYLGQQRLNEMTNKRIAELDATERAAVHGYLGRQLMHQVEKRLMLGFISRLWVDYLTAIEDLRQGIGLQAYAQVDPLVEYKRRAFRMFGELNDNIRRMVVNNIFRYPPEPLRLAQVAEQD